MPTATIRPMRIYRFMDDATLAEAVRDLERVTTQDAFDFAPPRERAAHLDALGTALSEAERRAL